MKHVALITLLCYVFFSPLAAQTDSIIPPRGEIIVSGGTTYPYLPSETKDYWKTGWNASVGYGYSFAPGSFGYGTVYLSTELTRSAFYESGYRKAFSLPDDAVIATKGSMRSFALMANFKGSFSPSMHTIAPFFLIGVGFMHFASDSLATSNVANASVESASLSGIAWSVGVGVEVPIVESVTAFVQGKSMLGVYDQQRQFFPVSAGVLWRL